MVAGTPWQTLMTATHTMKRTTKQVDGCCKDAIPRHQNSASKFGQEEFCDPLALIEELLSMVFGLFVLKIL